MSRTALPASLTDSSYWKRLLATVHPDRSGADHELFLFLQGLREHVESCACDGGMSGSTPHGRRFYDPQPWADRTGSERQGDEEPARVPFEAGMDQVALVVRALQLGQGYGPGSDLGELLLLLHDYGQATSGRGQLAEQRGASYKQLRYLAAVAELEPRVVYELAELVPFSQAMAHHLISTLKAERAA